MARTCPFCDRPAASAEHVYPQWMSRLFQDGAGPRAYFTMDFGSLMPQRRAKTLNQTVKVCATCNNGWMSRTEAEARPIFLRLAAGVPGPVAPAEQAWLARWFVKNALIHELLLPPEQRATLPEARAAFAAGALVPGWSVHVAAADDAASPFAHQMGPLISWTWDDGTHRGRARLNTSRFGQLAAQVVLHSLDEIPTFQDLLGGPDFAAPVPTDAPLLWPPGRRLTPEWFDIVADLG